MAPVHVTSNVHFSPGTHGGTQPSAPSAVTSITKDAGATVSFLPPGSAGDSAVVSYTATPYIAGVAQTPVTTAVASAGSITGSDGNTYVQIPVTGLTNATAYTFTVHASNTSGAGTESGASGANTPLSGLVFGDDFNGPASGAIDPEWWVYNRCGFLAQNEVQYYMPQHASSTGPGTSRSAPSTSPPRARVTPQTRSTPAPSTSHGVLGAASRTRRRGLRAAGTR